VTVLTTDPAEPLSSVLVANRGEIAVRVLRAARDAGMRGIAVHTPDEAGALHVRRADAACEIPSYLDIDAIVAAARATGAHAVHPGYGFLAENGEFASAVLAAGLVWVGPPPSVIRELGDKVTARRIARVAGAPLAAGTESPVVSADEIASFAAEHGLPLVIKAAFGGGGRGLKVVRSLDEIPAAFESATREAVAAFGRGECFVERFLEAARHVEAQVLADDDGQVVVVGTRDCSVQRRNQKLAEESPSPAVGPELRGQLFEAAVRAATAVGYRNAGTVECLLDVDSGAVVFLEMNTRLQVEHPVTEMVTGIDLVEQQLLIAAGAPVTFDPNDVRATGHALELRVNAEDPVRFLPGPGQVTRWEEPSGMGVRVDSGYVAGNTVTPHYDSLMAKLVVHGADRPQALERARAAVGAFVVEGPKCNLPFFAELLETPEFVSGDYDTGIVGRMRA
jgi:acetyl/propionyl-CoA carboxylase alpha subunit